jgi:hypothetical protein
MFIKVFVVHLMRPTYCTHIGIIATGKPFKALVNDYIMHQEISKTVSHDTKAYSLQPVHFIYRSEEYTQKAWYREDDKEGIILFKKTRPFLVMVFVQVP